MHSGQRNGISRSNEHEKQELFRNTWNYVENKLKNLSILKKKKFFYENFKIDLFYNLRINTL